MSIDVKATKQFALLQEVTQHIASGASTENILQQVSRHLLDKFGYRAIQIYQLSTGEKDVWLYLEMGQGNKPVTQTQDIFSVDEYNIISDAARRNELIYIPNLREAQYSYYVSHPEALFGSEMAMPLHFGTELVGVLRLECISPDGLNPNDLAFLAGLGHLLATAIRNNRKISQLEDSIQEIKTLYTLQHTARLEQQRHIHLDRPMGYEFDQSTIFKADRLPDTSPLAESATGVVAYQQNGHKELLAPIQLHGETVGVLGLEAEVQDTAPWTDEDIRLLEEVSLQVSLAIENARLLQQTQEQANELSILFEATRQLAETIDLQAIYKILNSQTINYVNANRSTVLLLNPARTHFEAIVCHHRNSTNQVVLTPTTRSEPIEAVLFSQLLKTPSMLTHHLDEPDLPPEVQQYMARDPETRVFTLTYFPLIVRSRLVGVLEVEHFYQHHTYTPNEIQLAQAIVSQVTVSIENAQLFQQTQTALENTQNLYQISRSLVESTSLDEVFSTILDTVKSYNVDRVSISLINRNPAGEIDQTIIAASWDRDPAYHLPVGTAFSTKNFSLVSAFSKPPFHPLISHNLRQVHGQDERMDNAFREYVVNSLNAITLFSAPMFLGATYKGVLSIYTRQPHIYTDEEIRVYQTLADQAIIAIENYRLLDATRLERDRASLLYELGQALSYTTSVEEVQQVVLGFIARLGAIDGELFITDGDEFASLASTIPERQKLPDSQILNLIHSNFHEALALNRHEILTLRQDGTAEIDWPLADQAGLSSYKMLVTVPFFSQRSALQGVLNLYHTDLDGFAPDQITTFEAVTIQMSASLENAWLLRQTNIVLRETELLYNVTRGFNSAQTVSDLVAVITQNLPNRGIDSLSIALLNHLTVDSKAEQLTTVNTWTKETGIISETPLQLNARDYPFITRFSSQFPVEVHYNRLDTTSQANIDRNLFGSRTLLAIPLSVGSAWLGVILLGSRKVNFPFKLNVTGQITTLAQQAAIVIQNLELVQETQNRLQETEILSALAQQLLTAETPAAIHDLTLTAMAATEPDRGVAIFMYDQIEGSVDIELSALWDAPGQPWPSISVGSRLSAEELGLVSMLKTGLTITSSNGPTDERFSPALQQLLQLMQIKVMVAVPLWLEKEVGGFILIGNATDRPFAVNQVRLYEAIARESSGALYNRKLFDEVQHRAWQLETAGAISQATTAYLDLDTLLFESVELIKQRFDFYHASIFLLDEYQRYAVVEASTGEIGQKMLEMGHKLEVGGRSIVGTATGTAKPCIALDVGKDAVHFNNPLLPDTRSEMALPLIAQGRVIGALDVQSTRRGAFSDSDITVLQSMANQLANAIEVARAYQKSKQALDEVSILHQKYMLDQWDIFLREEESTLGFHLTENGQVEKMAGLITPITTTTEKHAMIMPAHQPTNGVNLPEPAPHDWARLMAPLTLYGQSVIGAIDFDIPKNRVDKLVEEDILEIIEAVSEQTAQAVEAARLFEQSQVAREEAEALYEVGRSLVATEDEIEMFNLILGKLLSTLGLPQGGVLLFEDDRKTGRLHALYRDNIRVDKPNVTFPVANNDSYRKLIETKQPVPINDMATDPLVAKVREMNLAGNIASLLLVPIVINDEVIGAVGADAVGRPHKFTRREMNLAMAMADQLSIALQNRRLIEETRRRAILLQTSAEVGRVATSILEEDQLMEQVVELIRDRFGFYHVQIFLVDEAGQEAILHKSTGETGDKLLARHHQLAVGSGTVIGQTTALRRPIVVRSTDPAGSGPALNIDQLLPLTQAELGIPIQVGTTLLGALDVQSRNANAFSDEDISTLEALVAQLAIAIQNARVFREQQETAERLKEIDKLKTQFLANMSHELRTPLNSIIGFSRVILKGIDGPLTELQKADLTSIHNSGQHLLGLINNILDLSKIEAGKMELNFEDTEVAPIVKTVMSTAIALVKDKSVTLHQDVPDNLPKIWADSTRLRQIILNLVSNACKFTDEGTVTTKVFAKDNKVYFSVIDTGIGIPQEKLEHVFEEFTQVDASTTRKVGGTGLGLPISRHFVEMHHGKISVESEIGYGTTFTFFIPTYPSTQTPEEADEGQATDSTPASPSQKTVVVVDDDPAVVNLYRRFLESQHYNIIELNSGLDAAASIKEIAPFAILLDILVPGKDGWTILKELKEDAFTKNIPVIICSIVGDKNRGFALGAAGYLVKPVAETDLVGALNQLDNRQKGVIKVLLVDDNADDTLLVRRILEAQEEYTIFEATNGKQGLELVKSKSPDLIILDLNMPEMDGFGMIEALKENPATSHIPIIIVSAQEPTHTEHQKLSGRVKIQLRKGIFTEQELLEDVNLAISQMSLPEKTVI